MTQSTEAPEYEHSSPEQGAVSVSRRSFLLGGTAAIAVASSGVLAVIPSEATAVANPLVPDGWLLCNGQAISRSTYRALFDALGETYGAGDTVMTFNVPDFRGVGVAAARAEKNDPLQYTGLQFAIRAKDGEDIPAGCVLPFSVANEFTDPLETGSE